MTKEALYSTATSGVLKLRVPTGEIEVDDGTVFNTRQPRHTTNKQQADEIDKIYRAAQNPTLKSTATPNKRKQRKIERQNRRKGRA